MPPLAEGEELLSTISLSNRPLIQNEISEVVDAQVEYESKPENRVVVPEALKSVHPVVLRTEKKLRAAKPDERGICKSRANECLDVKVTPDSLERALRIMDALVKALDRRGFALCQNSGTNEKLSVEVNGEIIGFTLNERVMRNDHLPNEEEKKKIKKDRYYQHLLPKYDYVPTGKLSLKFDGWYDGRSTWSDAKIQQLEGCLNDYYCRLSESRHT